GLVVGFSLLFTSTIYKSESIYSDKDRLFTNKDYTHLLEYLNNQTYYPALYDILSQSLNFPSPNENYILPNLIFTLYERRNNTIYIYKSEYIFSDKDRLFTNEDYTHLSEYLNNQTYYHALSQSLNFPSPNENYILSNLIFALYERRINTIYIYKSESI